MMNVNSLFNSGDPAIQPEGGKPNRESFILTLPDELLVDILKRLYDPKPSCVREYAFTCKRFYQHLAPMMYRQICTPEDTEQLAYLYRTLIENPSLARECQHLSMTLRPYLEDDYKVLEDLVTRLANATSVRIHNNPRRGFGLYSMRLAQSCALDMASLQDLCLFSEGYGDSVEIREAMAAVQSASLNKLTIVNGISLDPRMWETDEGEMELEVEEDFGIATISELVLEKWRAPVEALDKLLLWTEGLTRFRLDHISIPSFNCDLGMMRSMLLNHKDTLVELSIGYFSIGFGDLPDLAEFKALRVLSLNQQNTGCNQNGSNGPAPLVAPNLTKFTWDFHYELFLTVWGSFTEAHEQWVRDFAAAAASRQTPDLEFALSFHPGATPGKKSFGYPWDRMDRLNDEFKHQGIAITYNKPPLTKEQWDEWGRSFEGDDDPNYQGTIGFQVPDGFRVHGGVRIPIGFQMM